MIASCTCSREGKVCRGSWERDVRCSPSGILYSLDANKIERLDGSTWVTFLESDKNVEDPFDPWYFCVTQGEVLWIADGNERRILRVDPRDQSITCVGYWPGLQITRMYVTDEEHVYVVDASHCKVVKFCQGYEQGLVVWHHADLGFRTLRDVLVVGDSLYILHDTCVMCHDLAPKIKLDAAQSVPCNPLP